MVGWREAGGLIMEGNSTWWGLEVGACVGFCKGEGLWFPGRHLRHGGGSQPGAPWRWAGIPSSPSDCACRLCASGTRRPFFALCDSSEEPLSSTIHFKRPFSPWGRLSLSQCLCALAFPWAPGIGSALCLSYQLSGLFYRVFPASQRRGEGEGPWAYESRRYAHFLMVPGRWHLLHE